jgi:hypothetical protein
VFGFVVLVEVVILVVCLAVLLVSLCTFKRDEVREKGSWIRRGARG